MHFYYISNEFINYYNEFINGRPRAPDMHDSEITIMVGQIFIWTSLYVQGTTNKSAQLPNHRSQVQVSYCISTKFIGILDIKLFFFTHKLTGLF